MKKNNSLNKIIIICGPTAVGKTAVGLELCRRLGGEVVSADSQQVYRGMDIGTAKDDLIGSDIPCHLVDIIDPDQLFDVAQFKEKADEVIKDIVSREKVPVVVGGTGFYIKVLVESLCEAPSRDEDIRLELDAIRDAKGAEAIYNILKSEDPLMAERLNVNDYQRVSRAIEVKRITGRSLSEFQTNQVVEPHYKAVMVGLNANRISLYQKINERVDTMIKRGLVEEVKGIVDNYGYAIQSLKAVGYKEIVGFLKGDTDLERAVFLTKRNTRRFAKRQLTWFRRDPQIEWFAPSAVDDIVEYVNNN
jgi:tRNA dimethylallyltransferase